MRTTRNTFGILGLVVLMTGSVSLVAQRGQSQRRGPVFVPMSGTYELETTRGDNAQRAASMATRNLPPQQRDRAYQNLLSRLQSPATIAIDRQGRNVTISSSNGPRTSFDADGQARSESWPGGRMTTTHAEFIGSRLSVSTSGGNRNSDYLVTFEPLNNGAGLLVTRRMDSDDLRGPVTVQSYYRRSHAEPRWDVYTPEPGYDRGGYAPRGPRPFVLVEGTQILAILDTQLSTRTARSGEHFMMTVQAPGEYQGARIDGIVARINQYGPGRDADMYVDFNTIQLRNGQSAQFDGVLSSVRTPNGMVFRVNGGDSINTTRTETTVEHGAIGAALGAIIGAIAGGGKGAAIGAVAGGAGGAILAQDRDQYLDLPPGTQVTVVVVAPRNRMP